MRERILDNVQQYTAEELARYIRAGIVTMEALVHETNGQFEASKRREVKRMLREYDLWNEVVEEGTIDAYEMYLEEYPEGEHAAEARSKVEARNAATATVTFNPDPLAGTSLAAKQSATSTPSTSKPSEGYNPFGVNVTIADTVTDAPASATAAPAADASTSSSTFGAGDPFGSFGGDAQAANDPNEENDWLQVDKSQLSQLQAFVQRYPSGQYYMEANKIINQLMLGSIVSININWLVDKIHEIETATDLNGTQKENKIVSTVTEVLRNNKVPKNDLLIRLRDDHNLLSGGVVRQLTTMGVLSLADLMSIGIDPSFLQKMLIQEVSQPYSTGTKVSSIQRQSTEVYFWGLPSSGKSCALGAILSVASQGVMQRDTTAQGYGYMGYLQGHFQNNIVNTLPPGTGIADFYEMGFELVDDKGKHHPITCIDMAGELMRCMYKFNADPSGSRLDDLDLEMLDTMTNILCDNRSVNRKMHFFVIEYGAHDRVYEGLKSNVYLEGAMEYIKNKGIFKGDTDGVYIVLNKADKARGMTGEDLKNYVKEHFSGFYQNLDYLCRTYEINGGKVEMLAFSIGNVCFQNYCMFDPRAASNVLNILKTRTSSYDPSRKGRIWGGFKK